MRESITLFRANGCWMARTTDEQVIRLFGTDVLPTPFTADCLANEVMARIAKLNPQADIHLS